MHLRQWRASNAAEVRSSSDAVFVMVMTGEEAKLVILGKDGLVSHMKAGGAVLLTVTIKSKEASGIAAALESSGINLIDSPVSGGYPGA